jgi:hypothetical protein
MQFICGAHAMCGAVVLVQGKVWQDTHIAMEGNRYPLCLSPILLGKNQTRNRGNWEE